MFNGSLKKEAIEKLNTSAESYKNWVKKVQSKSAELFVLRKKSSEEVISAVEAYINTLTNTPKEFDRSFAEYKAEFRIFNQMLRDLQIK
jgi:predicted HAD superfamily phosphohydrolase YqeG